MFAIYIPDGDIRDYELKTVNFGFNCAPFLAIRVLQQLADDEESKYPQASQVIRVYVEHHGFCDASQKAYGAAIYVRVEVGSTVIATLLTAKTRVAPVKAVSLPRLELCGALLFSEMATAVLPKIPGAASALYCWTDSTIVLAWLQKPACQWTTFVANRVTKITHCGGTELEKRAVKVHVAKAHTEDLLERFEANEVTSAERLPVSVTQRRHFVSEMGCLSKKRPVSASSPIQNLNPFVDSQGLMRACGRVTSSELLQCDGRHPIILPYDCHLSRLLVQFTHRITLHGGKQLMIRLIRAKFWIPRAIHLEPTSGLTTEKFLAAFARFVSQRGCPHQVQSDNGKTFVGAAALLSLDFFQSLKRGCDRCL
ncbi:uncharacterized protein [Drosophila bipectinata]|uniref:uncharacterized protein n=1 Tax=Drosophila bipectinata TaxID=42026 RepID=UPI0038B34113